MSGINYSLKALENALAQEEEILAAISNPHNHDETEKRHKLHIEQLKTDITKWKEWEKKQEMVQASQVPGTVEELEDMVKGACSEAYDSIQHTAN